MENIGIIPTIYRKLARVEKALGNFNQARLYLLKGLTIAEENSDRLNIFHLIGECCFTEIARARALNAAQTTPELTSTENPGHLMRAAYFLGKYQELMEELHIPVFIEHKQEYEQSLVFLPALLGQVEWETTIKEGRSKSVKELIIMMVW